MGKKGERRRVVGSLLLLTDGRGNRRVVEQKANHLFGPLDASEGSESWSYICNEYQSVVRLGPLHPPVKEDEVIATLRHWTQHCSAAELEPGDAQRALVDIEQAARRAGFR